MCFPNFNFSDKSSSVQAKMLPQSRDICEEIVKDVLESVTQGAGESNTSANTTCDIGEWVEDTTLGGGWKTCLLNSDGVERRMFYSPCGRLLHSYEEVQRYLEDVFSSYSNIRRKMSLVEDILSTPISPFKPLDVSLTELRSEDLDFEDLQFEDDEILLSDEEYQEPPEKKRRLCEEDVPHVPEPLPAVVEHLLSACHAEWPTPSADILTSILEEVATMAGLTPGEREAVTRQRVESWYSQKNRDLFIQLFNAV